MSHIHIYIRDNVGENLIRRSLEAVAAHDPADLSPAELNLQNQIRRAWNLNDESDADNFDLENRKKRFFKKRF